MTARAAALRRRSRDDHASLLRADRGRLDVVALGSRGYCWFVKAELALRPRSPICLLASGEHAGIADVRMVAILLRMVRRPVPCLRRY